MIKLCLSDNKLRSILNENFDNEKVDKTLVKDFRSWLQKQARELNKEERKGELFNTWLFDMGRYFVQKN